MRKLILVAFLLFNNVSIADVVIMDRGEWPVEQTETAPDILNLSPILKVGGWPGAESSTSVGVGTGFVFAVESATCEMFCLSPNITYLKSEYDTNSGIGVDVVFKPRYRMRDTFRISLGVVEFQNPLNGGVSTNFHAGVGFELYVTSDFNIMLSYDHYSNGRKLLNRESQISRNVPTQLLTIGLRFK